MNTPAIKSYDFHCHIDLYPSPTEIIIECEKRAAFVLAVTTTPEAWPQNKRWMQDKKFVRPALGFHPGLASNKKHEVSLFDSYIKETSYVGEVGLDGSKELNSSWGDQSYIFNHILQTCQREGGKILSIHSRKAAAHVIDALKNNSDAGIFILHWFSGSKKDLERAIDIGCWFSIGPKMAMSKKGTELISLMPKDRILTETDAPFASFNNRDVMPWDVSFVEKKLADIWNISLSETHAIFSKNFTNLINKLK